MKGHWTKVWGERDQGKKYCAKLDKICLEIIKKKIKKLPLLIDI